MTSYFSIINALLPVLILIFLGLCLKQLNFLNEDGWAGLEKLSYHVFFPAVTITSLIKIDIAKIPVLAIGSSLAGGIVVMSALLIFLKPLIHKLMLLSNPAFTSVYQGATRWNSFVALALCITLYGETGLMVASIAILTMIPTVNILGVMVLAHYGRGEKIQLLKTLLTLLKNPFIWSSLIGLFLNLSGLNTPVIFMKTADILAQSALAGGLLMVGVGLNLNALKRPKGTVFLGLFLKLLLSPLIVYLIASAWGISGPALNAMLLCSGVPTASASYILAKTSGGDAEVMAEIITIQTVFAVITLPIWLSL